MRRILLMASLLAPICASTSAQAKQRGVHSPGGRSHYNPEETFEDVIDQDHRNFVIEVAVGSGPEGNLALVLGWLAKDLKGVEFYAGVGYDWVPNISYSGAVRYLMNFSGHRPYVGLGYVYQRTPVLGLVAHKTFGEVGYSWVVHHTYHLTVGVGAEYMMDLEVLKSSDLRGPESDEAFLDEAVDDVARWRPTAVLRLSRAF